MTRRSRSSSGAGHSNSQKAVNLVQVEGIALSIYLINVAVDSARSVTILPTGEKVPAAVL